MERVVGETNEARGGCEVIERGKTGSHEVI